MSDNVTPLHTPAQRAEIAAREHYENETVMSGGTLTGEEKVAVAHVRGWTHFGPLCPMCTAEAKR
jgi:hypothetical protein